MSISKVQAMVAMPLNKNSNILYYDVPNQNGQIDMKSSYQELEMVLYDASNNKVTNMRNIVLGHDGLYYNASCLFRNSTLKESKSNKVYQDMTYVNVLSNNLEYWTKGVNNIESDALYSGQGYVGSDNLIQSVFNNNYSDVNPIVRCPLSCLYPGDIGDSDALPQSADFEFRYLLEPQYNVLMRAVSTSSYVMSDMDNDESNKEFGNALVGATTLTASDYGTVVGTYYAAEMLVSVKYTDTAVEKTVIKRIETVIVDVTTTSIGSISFATPISANAITGVTISKLSNTPTIPCNDLLGAAADPTILTLTIATPPNVDLYVGTVIGVSYFDSSSLTQKTGTRTIGAISVDGSGNIATATLTEKLLFTAGAVNISIGPLYTNLDSYNWSVLSSYLILYRKNVPMVSPESMLISTFDSKNVQCVGGLDKFTYTFKASPNAFNCFVFTPNTTNLYSQADEYNQYMITVNEIHQLSSIYIPSVNSVIHLDNMVKTLGNSIVYKPKNLSNDRDNSIWTDIAPKMICGKIFNSMDKGETNEQDFNAEDNDVKVEMLTSTGNTTIAKTVYFFTEKFLKV